MLHLAKRDGWWCGNSIPATHLATQDFEKFDNTSSDRRCHHCYENWRKATTGSVAFEQEVRSECNALAELLIEKNKHYGDSALNPVRIVSKASPEEQILVRIDDKLSRLGRGAMAGEDVWMDLLGYIVLLRITQKRKNKEGSGT